MCRGGWQACVCCVCVWVCEQIWKEGDLRDKEKDFSSNTNGSFKVKCDCAFMQRSHQLHCKPRFGVHWVWGLFGGKFHPHFEERNFESHFQEILNAGWEPSAVQMLSAGGRNKRSSMTFIWTAWLLAYIVGCFIYENVPFMNPPRKHQAQPRCPVAIWNLHLRHLGHMQLSAVTCGVPGSQAASARKTLTQLFILFFIFSISPLPQN